MDKFNNDVDVFIDRIKNLGYNGSVMWGKRGSVMWGKRDDDILYMIAL